MLSHLKSYLFGGSEANATQDQNSPCRKEEEDWVLVDCQDDIKELPICDEDVTLVTSLEESWIVTRTETANKSSLFDVTAGKGPANANKLTRQQQRTARQPKGTKQRRLRAANLKNKASSSGALPSSSCLFRSVNDSDSTTSSIAIIASPEPRAASAASSPVLASSLADVKQVAAISSAKIAKQKTEKTLLSRKNMMRGNQSLMVAASGRNLRRSHHIASRLCGSNNNRNSHYSKC